MFVVFRTEGKRKYHHSIANRMNSVEKLKLFIFNAMQPIYHRISQFSLQNPDP